MMEYLNSPIPIVEIETVVKKKKNLIMRKIPGPYTFTTEFKSFKE